MPYLLDTNTVIAFMKGKEPVVTRYREARLAELRICTNNVDELSRVPGLAVEDWIK